MDKAKVDLGILLKIRQLRESKAARSLSTADVAMKKALQEELSAKNDVTAATRNLSEARQRHTPAEDVYITGVTLKAAAENLGSYKAALVDKRAHHEDARIAASEAKKAYTERLEEFRKCQVAVIKTEATAEALTRFVS
ncbi:hypothetical protein G6L28_15215 [Agrobacterium larrymoorei]|uniref:hypothetical protein n=1 Tax=Agrobacterium larrymoorei TaxID=160699 RepID=UPI0015746350|nr:hypothetical protein [Agrobacterium larrymoorei]NTJ43949.1 hypothetical protein [Agrobacterium larrymoorei]